MKRRLLFLAAAALLLLSVGPACGGDDDGDDDDASGDKLGPVGAEGGVSQGTLNLAGKNYKVQIRECRTQGATGTIFFAGAVEGEDRSVFGGAGVAGAASLGIEIGGVQYIGAGSKLEVDGSRVSHKGQILKAGASEAVAIEFEFECG